MQAIMSGNGHPDEGPCVVCGQIFDLHAEGCVFETRPTESAEPPEFETWPDEQPIAADEQGMRIDARKQPHRTAGGLIDNLRSALASPAIEREEEARDIAGDVWDFLTPYLPPGNRTELYDKMRARFPEDDSPASPPAQECTCVNAYTSEECPIHGAPAQADNAQIVAQQLVNAGLHTRHVDVSALARDIVAALASRPSPDRDTEQKYNELLLAVEIKFEGESRHETALRLIKERQNQTMTSQAADREKGSET
jgi:hypothetical protein